MGSTHKASLWIPAEDAYVREEDPRLCEVGAEAASFSGRSFLIERIIDKLWLCRPRYLKDIFSQMNGTSPSFQRKQLTEFVTINKIQSLKSKIEVWNTCTYHKLDSSPLLKDFLIQSVALMNSKFFYCTKKCVNMWKNCITRWIKSHQMRDSWYHKNHA